MAALIFWILMVLKTKSPGLYEEAERKAGLSSRSPSKKTRRRRSKKQVSAARRAKRAHAYRKKHGVTLKEAWKHV